MQGFTDLLQSERGVFSMFALTCVTVLAILKVIPGEEALDYIKLLTGFLIASKTVTTAVETHANRQTIPRADVVVATDQPVVVDNSTPR